ncbi:transposase [Micromonospora sp. NPDC002717]|uniref:transposase n=1 Tax=Micromonospora sp. NPDC002717 TaxID=3154424 RepID=UPI00332351E2
MATTGRHSRHRHTDASSGSCKRHRPNTDGNRQLNSALHFIAVVQAHYSDLGRAYYQRRFGEGGVAAIGPVSTDAERLAIVPAIPPPALDSAGGCRC